MLTIALLFAMTTLTAQDATFDVASVKRNTSGSTRSDWDRTPSGDITYINVTLGHLIREAYSVREVQIIGGPAWLDRDRFDVTAKAPGRPSPDVDAMMRALLVDRFRLSARREKREQPVYELVRAKEATLGPRIKPRPDCANREASAETQCGGLLMGPGRLTLRGMDAPAIAGTLSTDRIIVDRTGLTGRFDVELEWMPEGAPSIFTAVQEQLGLRLQPARAVVDVLVIDRAEPPSEN